jgi:hypothetical protein
MSDSDEPSQQPTPSKTPKRPQPPVRSDSDQSIEDPGYQSGRSRSQSRRRRRQNQRQRAQQQQQNQPGGGSHGAQTTSMAKIDEEKGAEAETQAQTTTMKPFERIGTLALQQPFPILFAILLLLYISKLFTMGAGVFLHPHPTHLSLPTISLPTCRKLGDSSSLFLFPAYIHPPVRTAPRWTL